MSTPPCARARSPRWALSARFAALVLSLAAWPLSAQPTAPAMVKDIRVGSADPNIESPVNVNGLVFFVASIGASTGTELWRTDGTEAGTRMVVDLNDGFSGSAPHHLVAFNNLLYFTANDGQSRELWRSDGSAAGTLKVVHLTLPGDVSASPEHLTVLANTLFFTIRRDGARQLWKTDGTGPGTELVRAFSATDGNPTELATAGPLLFIKTVASNGVLSLWRSDGTTSGTEVVKSFPDGDRLGFASPKMAAIGATLYFVAYEHLVAGAELWKSDGTAAGTVMVKDIWPGTSQGVLPSSMPRRFVPFANGLAFLATDQTGSTTLFHTDGTAQGTIAWDFLPITFGLTLPQTPVGVVHNGALFVWVGGTSPGLWRTDGTPAGTSLVLGITSATLFRQLPVVVGQLMYFSGVLPSEAVTFGEELWRSDGTPGGTHRVADIAPGFGSSDPTDLTAGGDVLFFVANDGVHGREMWRLGTPVIRPADLQLTASVSSATVPRNTNVTYTFTVTNLGPHPAAGVGVEDTLPTGLTFVSCTAAGGVCGGAGRNRLIGYTSIPAGESRSSTVVATVTGSVGTQIVNTPAVSAVSSDPVASNNTVSISFAVGPAGTPTDTDADGLPNEWEARFGLSTSNGGGDDGANGDPDTDGRTNAQEFADGTHPRGTFGRFLSEGATGSFFRTRIALLNPGAAHTKVLLRFLKSDGTTVPHFVDLPGRRRGTVEPHLIAGLGSAEFSTSLEADGEVVVDRTMTWGDGYGSHAESGVPTPAPTWYLAEGSTVGPFNLFYLLQNPSLTTPATVQVTFLLPAGAPVVKTFVIPANSRQNIWVDDIAELRSTDVSAVLQVTAGPNIIVERAMYLDRAGQPFAAGHESAGITAPALDWFFAEGATGAYFDEFILIANPNASLLDVRATFLLPSGQTLTKDYSIAPNSRFNIWVDEESFPGVGRALADTAVSVTLTGLNGVPYIAERAMWWPGPTSDTWSEAHNSPGATATGPRWALADGEVGGASSIDTYILIANTSRTAAQVKVTLLLEDGRVLEAPTPFDVAAQSRFNVWVKAEFPEADGQRFGAIVESVGATPAQLVVERAMYSNAAGVVWAAGTNALAARLR